MCLSWGLLVLVRALALVIVVGRSGSGSGCNYNSVCNATWFTAAARMGLHAEACWVSATGDKSLSLLTLRAGNEEPSRFLGSAQLKSKRGMDVIMWEVGMCSSVYVYFACGSIHRNQHSWRHLSPLFQDPVALALSIQTSSTTDTYTHYAMVLQLAAAL
jgi:hypothetical protein